VTESSKLPAELLEWDSDFFGFPVARIPRGELTPELWRRVYSWGRSQGVRCLYYEAEAGDLRSIAMASSAGFNLVDVRIGMERLLIPAGEETDKDRLEAPGRLLIRPADQSDVQAVAAMARDVAGMSRFSVDERFPRGAAADLYVRWVKKGIEVPAWGLLVGALASEIAGFVVCERGTQGGRIVLVAVGPDYRCQGVGTSIVGAGIAWFREQGCEVAKVATQAGNIPALRLYQKVGFRPECVSLLFHRWFA